jgi:hypothetical protein
MRASGEPEGGEGPVAATPPAKGLQPRLPEPASTAPGLERKGCGLDSGNAGLQLPGSPPRWLAPLRKATDGGVWQPARGPVRGVD